MAGFARKARERVAANEKDKEVEGAGEEEEEVEVLDDEEQEDDPEEEERRQREARDHLKEQLEKQTKQFFGGNNLPPELELEGEDEVLEEAEPEEKFEIPLDKIEEAEEVLKRAEGKITSRASTPRGEEEEEKNRPLASSSSSTSLSTTSTPSSSSSQYSSSYANTNTNDFRRKMEEAKREEQEKKRREALQREEEERTEAQRQLKEAVDGDGCCQIT